MSRRAKEWHKTHEHPRGYKGHKHSAESKRKISEKSKAQWRNPESPLNSPEHRQRSSDRAIQWARERKSSTNRYSRCKAGKREDLGGLFVRSAWEANYARYLDWKQKQGVVHRWEYEPDTFAFHEIRRGLRLYTPDFKVWDTEDAEPYYVEVKGWMDPKSKTRLKRMAKYYPDVEIRVVGAREYRVLSRQLRGLIQNWE